MWEGLEVLKKISHLNNRTAEVFILHSNNQRIKKAEYLTLNFAVTQETE